MSFLEVDCAIARRDFDVTVRFSLAPGEVVALFGPSGAGKSTVIETIAGLVEPASGGALLGDVRLSRPVAPGARAARRRRSVWPAPATTREVAIVRQPTTLLPHLDVTANIAYGDADRARVPALLERSGLSGLEHARPSELSGGQAQRVALARALARPFGVLLLDEPMSAIDHPSRPGLWSLVRERLAEERSSAVLVTHDLAEAQRFGDRLALVDRGEMLSIGSPEEIVRRPASRRAAELVGYGGWLTLRPRHGRFPDGSTTCEVGIDPRRVRPGLDDAGRVTFVGTIEDCSAVGTAYETTVAIAEGAAVTVAAVGECSVAGPESLSIYLDAPVEPGRTLEVTALHAAVVFGDTPG